MKCDHQQGPSTALGAFQVDGMQHRLPLLLRGLPVHFLFLLFFPSLPLLSFPFHSFLSFPYLVQALHLRPLETTNEQLPNRQCSAQCFTLNFAQMH